MLMVSRRTFLDRQGVYLLFPSRLTFRRGSSSVSVAETDGGNIWSIGARVSVRVRNVS